MAIKLNIKLFDEGGASISAANNLASEYDAEIPACNTAIQNNYSVLETLRAIAGSPKIDENTRELINGLNTSIEDSATYFDSVRSWHEGVTSGIMSILGSSVSSISNSFDRETLNQIGENYEGDFVGFRDLSDVDNFISGMTEVITTLRGGLEGVTNAVANAKNSIMDEILAAFSGTVSTNNEAIYEGYDKLTTYLNENLDSFKTALSSFISDSAAAAKGGA